MRHNKPSIRVFVEEKKISMHKISFYQTHLTEGQ